MAQIPVAAMSLQDVSMVVYPELAVNDVRFVFERIEKGCAVFSEEDMLSVE